MKITKPNPRMLTSVAAVALLAVTGGYVLGSSTARHDTADTTPSITAVASRASATDHNAVDVRFTQMMTPHHSQAIDMATMAATRASSTQVKTLAAKIEAAQQPEIDKMTSWLKDWNATSTSTGHRMDGMMSERDMRSLESMSGAAFDRTFLTMMIQHHSGAITMAKSELADGKNAEALALATSIQVTQQAEVNQMKALLQ